MDRNAAGSGCIDFLRSAHTLAAMTTALWCLVAAAVFHVASKIPLLIAQAREGYDNRHPRDQQARLTGWGGRARAIHANQIESFPLFAAGILVASTMAPAHAWIDILALAYIGSRVVYTGLYLANAATLRSLVWSVGFLASVALIASPAWCH